MESGPSDADWQDIATARDTAIEQADRLIAPLFSNHEPLVEITNADGQIETVHYIELLESLQRINHEAERCGAARRLYSYAKKLNSILAVTCKDLYSQEVRERLHRWTPERIEKCGPVAAQRNMNPTLALAAYQDEIRNFKQDFERERADDFNTWGNGFGMGYGLGLLVNAVDTEFSLWPEVTAGKKTLDAAKLGGSMPNSKTRQAAIRKRYYINIHEKLGTASSLSNRAKNIIDKYDPPPGENAHPSVRTITRYLTGK